MKNFLLMLIFTFLSFIAFGKNIYTLSKEDFIKQFSDSSFSYDRLRLSRIYCHNEKGDKVWLYFNQNSILIATLNDNRKKELMLHSIKYVIDEIQAKEFNVWMPRNKIYKINEIASLTIEKKYKGAESPYFNVDSVRVLCDNKNDSIKKLYSTGNEYVVSLILTNKRKKDTLLIMEKACYHMKFKDNSETVFGVVQKITKDSIIISSSFNQNMANWHKKEFKIYHFPINDISEIKLLKTGGYSFKTIKMEDVPFEVIERKKEIKNRPIWYSFYATLGEIDFYRAFFIEGGLFGGVAEKGGNPISFMW